MARSLQPYDGEPVNYQLIARTEVRNYYNELPGHQITLDDVYVVWFSKTLKNWKAMVSTTVPDDRYYEVTHDGEEKLTYVDVYKKADQVILEG